MINISDYTNGVTGVQIDTETGGLSPTNCGLTEIAAIRFVIGPDWTLHRGEVFNCLVKPQVNKQYQQRALDIQGRTLQEIEDRGVPLQEAVTGLHDFLKKSLGENPAAWGSRLWAHNAPFDAGFIRQAFIDCGLTNVFPERCDWSDTKALASALKGLGVALPDSLSLKYLAEHFGVTTEGHHGALVDCKISIEVLTRLLGHIKK